MHCLSFTVPCLAENCGFPAQNRDMRLIHLNAPPQLLPAVPATPTPSPGNMHYFMGIGEEKPMCMSDL